MYPKQGHEANKSQYELAQKIDINKQTYYLKEKGKSDFTIQEGLRLAKIFNCTLNDLFEDEAKKLRFNLSFLVILISFFNNHTRLLKKYYLLVLGLIK